MESHIMPTPGALRQDTPVDYMGRTSVTSGMK
jgi:hypothetical protein